jgi:hypothetical protein
MLTLMLSQLMNELLKKGTKTKMFQNCNAYYFNAELEKAAKWYSELFLMNDNQVPDLFIGIHKR